MGLRHACWSAENLGKRLLFLLDNIALVLGASKPQPHLTRNFVSSLSPRPSSPSAIELRQKIIRPTSHLAPSVAARACTPMLTNVGRRQRGQPPTRSCLPSSQPKPHELPVKKRKLECNRHVALALVSPTKIEEEWKQVRRRREERGAHLSGESGLSASPLRRVVLSRAEPSHRSDDPTLHAHAQRVPGLWKNVAGRAEVTGKVGRDGGGDAGTHVLSRLRSRSWRLLDGSNQVRRVDSKFLRSSPRRTSAERVPSVSTGYVSGPSPVGCGSDNDGSGDGCERRRVCGDARDPVCAYLRPSELGNLTAGQVIRPLKESGADSWALLLAPQEELKTSKTGESVLLDVHLSIAIVKFLTRYTGRKAATTPLWSRSQAKYAVAFAKRAETSGVHVITTVRHGGASSDALRRTRSLIELQKRGRWRSEKSVRRYEKHAQ